MRTSRQVLLFLVFLLVLGAAASLSYQATTPFYYGQYYGSFYIYRPPERVIIDYRIPSRYLPYRPIDGRR